MSVRRVEYLVADESGALDSHTAISRIRLSLDASKVGPNFQIPLRLKNAFAYL